MNIRNLAVIIGVIIATSTLTTHAQGGAASLLKSQGYKATGDDGITDSPKYRQFLNDWNHNHGHTPAVAEVAKMPCAKCTDLVTNVPDVTSKGLGARALKSQGVPTKTVMRHQCPGCGVDWKIVGVGKGKHASPTHKCAACGSENLACCNTTSDVATKGMETKSEIAPLK